MQQVGIKLDERYDAFVFYEDDAKFELVKQYFGGDLERHITVKITDFTEKEKSDSFV